MISILENNQIDQCSEEQRRQVMNFAFGEEFMASNDKGTLKQEREVERRYDPYLKRFVEGKSCADKNEYHSSIGGGQ